MSTTVGGSLMNPAVQACHDKTFGLECIVCHCCWFECTDTDDCCVFHFTTIICKFLTSVSTTPGNCTQTDHWLAEDSVGVCLEFN